ncbi:insulin receptor substrate 1 isoform X2 [Pectinophora gossypiella]|uniref:insulin receptor substrate 1 isoform X2 n=1 Tax=Pectinophora gossypiella TaxID=13191 RepID=UPI00214F17B4|nr:insulin receptor substrate 1 isoform X2 [Pectinophora gossypiella]
MSAAAVPAAGAGAALRAGHLRKLKTMKKKYFVLRGETPECSARLEYYESEKKYRSGAVPRRVIPLKSCYNITRRLDLKQKHVIALFTREEQFCIVAENEQDLHGWLTAILKQHRNDDASEELLHPIQHVWQVNVQKKGLGATKNIQGLYNLCLTDKTLTLVKIKSQNNVISDLGIPERVEYSLKNIRRCGDSECFFYMEVGRQTATGAGELWMHSDDSNIAQSMHSTIYHAMRNCAKETENERDHIVIPKRSDSESSAAPPARRQTYSDARGRAGLANDKGLCVGSCIRQCVCAATHSVDDSAAALAPLATKHDAGPLRNRCDSMPSRACSSFEIERPPQRHNDNDSLDTSRDEADSIEWHRTPRIPEEPDFCDPAIRDLMSTSLRGSSIQHSRTSSIGVDDPPESCPIPDGYLPMAPHTSHEPGGLVSASSGSVCSGTPSTDPRFSEYQLEPATSHIVETERPLRAYSVGSRPAPRADPPRHRAYSVGARARPARPAPQASSAPLLPRAPPLDLMELDFSNNCPAKVVVCGTPPQAGFPAPSVGITAPRPKAVDEYVDMSPRNAGYVEMRPGDLAPPPQAQTPDGYVEMNYGRAATRPIPITTARPAPAPAPVLAASPDDRRRKNGRESRTPLGSQTLFPLSLDSPASPPELDATDVFDEDSHEAPHHPLSTVREISEEGGRKSPEVSSSPSYVKLVYGSKPIAAPNKTPEAGDELSCNPLANKTLARADPERAPEASTATVVLAGAGGAAARFSVCAPAPAPTATPAAAPAAPGGPLGAPLNYAALDLEPKKAPAVPAHRTYTKIDFALSEKLHAADAN